MIVIGAYVAGHSYLIPLGETVEAAATPSAEQEKKVEYGRDVDDTGPMPQ
jgi:hypothetical protein